MGSQGKAAVRRFLADDSSDEEERIDIDLEEVEHVDWSRYANVELADWNGHTNVEQHWDMAIRRRESGATLSRSAKWLGIRQRCLTNAVQDEGIRGRLDPPLVIPGPSPPNSTTNGTKTLKMPSQDHPRSPRSSDSSDDEERSTQRGIANRTERIEVDMIALELADFAGSTDNEPDPWNGYADAAYLDDLYLPQPPTQEAVEESNGATLRESLEAQLRDIFENFEDDEWRGQATREIQPLLLPEYSYEEWEARPPSRIAEEEGIAPEQLHLPGTANHAIVVSDSEATTPSPVASEMDTDTNPRCPVHPPGGECCLRRFYGLWDRTKRPYAIRLISHRISRQGDLIYDVLVSSDDIMRVPHLCRDEWDRLPSLTREYWRLHFLLAPSLRHLQRMGYYSEDDLRQFSRSPSYWDLVDV